MKKIPLTQGKEALVDDADFEAVSRFRWHARKHRVRFYAARNIQKPDGTWNKLFLHTFLVPEGPQVDHRDGDGLNNQRHNLRPATNRQNLQGFRTKPSNCSSQFRGVTWNKARRKWQTKIRVGEKHIYLGLFTSETAAAKAYDLAAHEHFRDFAAPNFP